MADRYFDKFPLVYYSNNFVVDITRRVALLESVSTNPYAFYPYDIEDNERADQFCSRYYDDAYKSWVIYLGNKIADPYYEWYLQNNEFYEYLEKKYGSVYNAQQKIKFYRNDWETEQTISTSEYNALPFSMKKYWEPEYGTGSSILNYKRKQIDWTVNTNKLVSYQVSNTSFIKDEICEIKIESETLGKGQFVSTVNSSAIYLQHVSGAFIDTIDLQLNSNSYVHGTESGANTIVTNITAVANNISEEETIYWKAVTYLDFEAERNEYNKSIRVIDKDLQYVVVDNLTDLLKENT
jgi:hypothetical protein